MEAAVRGINPSTHIDDVLKGWNKPAICLRGRKYATCVINDDGGIHLVKLPIPDYDRYARAMPQIPAAVAKQMLGFTTRGISPKPITQGALELLNRVASGDIPAEDIEFKDDPILPPAGDDATTPNGHTPRSSLLATICAELKIEPVSARRRLRKAGLHAPYEDEATIRGALK